MSRLLLTSEAHVEKALKQIFLQQIQLHNDSILLNNRTASVNYKHIETVSSNFSLLIDSLFPKIAEIGNSFLKVENTLQSQMVQLHTRFNELAEKNSIKQRSFETDLFTFLNQSNQNIEHLFSKTNLNHSASHVSISNSLDSNKKDFIESFKNLSSTLLSSEANLLILLNNSNEWFSSVFEKMGADLIQSEINLLNYINSTTFQLEQLQNESNKIMNQYEQYFLFLSGGLLILVVFFLFFFVFFSIFLCCFYNKQGTMQELKTEEEREIDQLLEDSDTLRNRSADPAIMSAEQSISSLHEINIHPPSVSSIEDERDGEDCRLQSSLARDSIWKSICCCISCKNTNPDVAFPLKEFANRDRRVY